VNNHSTLLTIAVPTYNRADCLDDCLAHIVEQTETHTGLVELLISDNCSTDSTEAIVKNWVSRGLKINYIRNRENIGPDDNFLQCFNKASGKYVWILGDDDLVLDDALDAILKILKEDDYGLLFLNSYGFIEDHNAEKPAGSASGHEVYDELSGFLGRVGYSLTFISSSIVNRELGAREMCLDGFRSTNLIQLAWVFSALFNSRRNAFLKSYAVAARACASGGYKLCEVFGQNFQRVFDIYIRRGVPAEYFEIIKRKMLMKFFPANIIRARNNILATKQEDYFKALYPIYGGYICFWLFTVPAIILPARLALLVLKAAEAVRKRLPD